MGEMDDEICQEKYKQVEESRQAILHRIECLYDEILCLDVKEKHKVRNWLAKEKENWRKDKLRNQAMSRQQCLRCKLTKGKHLNSKRFRWRHTSVSKNNGCKHIEKERQQAYARQMQNPLQQEKSRSEYSEFHGMLWNCHKKCNMECLDCILYFMTEGSNSSTISSQKLPGNNDKSHENELNCCSVDHTTIDSLVKQNATKSYQSCNNADRMASDDIKLWISDTSVVSKHQSGHDLLKQSTDSNDRNSRTQNELNEIKSDHLHSFSSLNIVESYLEKQASYTRISETSDNFGVSLNVILPSFSGNHVDVSGCLIPLMNDDSECVCLESINKNKLSEINNKEESVEEKEGNKDNLRNLNLSLVHSSITGGGILCSEITNECVSGCVVVNSKNTDSNTYISDSTRPLEVSKSDRGHQRITERPLLDKYISSQKEGRKINLTIPEPFILCLDQRKQKWQKCIEEKVMKIKILNAEKKNQRIHPNPIPGHTFLPFYQRMVEESKERAKWRKVNLIERHQSFSQPFHFQTDKRCHEVCCSFSKHDSQNFPSEHGYFRAKPVSLKMMGPESQIKINLEEEIRQMCIRLRSKELLKDSVLPFTEKTKHWHCCNINLKNSEFITDNLSKNSTGTTADMTVSNDRKSSSLKMGAQPFSFRTSRLPVREQCVMHTRDTEKCLKREPVYILRDFKSQSFPTSPVKMTRTAQLRVNKTRERLLDEKKKTLRYALLENEHKKKEDICKEYLSRLTDQHPFCQDIFLQKKLRQVTLEREQEYQLELEEMRERVWQRPFLMEQQGMETARQVANKKFINKLEEVGLDENYITRKSNMFCSTECRSSDVTDSRESNRTSDNERAYSCSPVLSLREDQATEEDSSYTDAVSMTNQKMKTP